MKKILFSLLVLTLSISSCNKEDDFNTNESQSLSEDVKEKG